MGDRAEIAGLVDELMQGQVSRRQFIGRGAALGLSATALGSLLAACGDSASTRGGGDTSTLNVRNWSGDPVTMDPLNMQGTTDEPAAELVYEGLTAYKPDSDDVVLRLAESMDQSEDGLEYSFKLKSGIPFHGDYGEMTAEDVKFSFERTAGVRPKAKGNASTFWDALEAVKVENKHQVTVRLRHPDATVPTSIFPTMAPGAVYSKRAFEELGEDKFATQPVGTGPYQLTEWRPKSRFVFKRFDNYGGAIEGFAKPPQWDVIVWQSIPDDNAAYAALRAGNIDFTSNLPLQDVASLEKNNALSVEHHSEGTCQGVFLSVADKYLRDKNLRQAIRYAVDVNAALQASYSGVWPRANAIVPEEMGLGYWKDAPVYERDVAAAKSFLSKAGHAQGLGLKMHVHNDPQSVSLAQVVESGLKDIGVKLQIVPQDDASFQDVPGVGGGGKNRQLSAGWRFGGVDPARPTVQFTCQQVGLWNWCDWCDGRFTKLYAQGLAETDADKRNELYVEMQRIQDENVNTIYIGQAIVYWASTKNVRSSFRKGDRPLYWNFRSA